MFFFFKNHYLTREDYLQKLRKLAFGYSTKCNIKYEHCVANGNTLDSKKMDYDKAKEIIVEMAHAGVAGISFSAGEAFFYITEIAELVRLCSQCEPSRRA